MIDSSDVFVALIFECAVVLVSRFTDGYLFGLLASFLGVVGVNWIFTYPYMQLNFTISGYPLTFLVMLAVSVVVSALTTQIKQQEKLRAEAEKEKMRGNLLRAVSHDIRTPLTAIVGGIDAILENGEKLSPETRTSLLENMRDESNWLIGVVENLLSVTRMSGASQIKKELEAGEEVLSAAAMKFQRHYPATKVSISAPEELLMIDDLKPGFDMAHSCGVDFAAAGWAYDVPQIEDFMRRNSDFYFKTVQELADFLGE